ncbi:MAG: hypothetical protein ACREU0_05240, partial [Burkholderiales bacterium]
MNDINIISSQINSIAILSATVCVVYSLLASAYWNECAREGAQSAWWKSTPGEAITLEVEGNCVVVRRGGEQ